MPSEHLRLTVIGSIATGLEEFAWSTNWAPRGNVAIADVKPPDMTVIYNAVRTYHAGKMQVSSGAALQAVKLAHLNSEGHYARDPWIGTTTPANGQVLTTQSTPQDSFVVTFWTGKKLGKTNYGRCYLPWCGLTIDNPSATITPGVQMTNLKDGWSTMMAAIRAELRLSFNGSGNQPIVQVIPGAVQNEVKTWRFGNIVDTQRRRRRSLPETYDDVVVP